jgi:hypothetical protein
MTKTINKNNSIINFLQKLKYYLILNKLSIKNLNNFYI